MTNKVLREKSNCANCWSSKSRFKKKTQQQKIIQWQHKSWVCTILKPVKSKNNF